MANVSPTCFWRGAQVQLLHTDTHTHTHTYRGMHRQLTKALHTISHTNPRTQKLSPTSPVIQPLLTECIARTSFCTQTHVSCLRNLLLECFAVLITHTHTHTHHLPCAFLQTNRRAHTERHGLPYATTSAQYSSPALPCRQLLLRTHAILPPSQPPARAQPVPTVPSRTPSLSHTHPPTHGHAHGSNPQAAICSPASLPMARLP